MDDVVDLLGTVLDGLVLLLLRRVRAWTGCQMGPRSSTRSRTNVNVALLDDDHLAVNLVDGVVDELAVCIRVSAPIGGCGTLGATHMGKASENISSPVRISS